MLWVVKKHSNKNSEDQKLTMFYRSKKTIPYYEEVETYFKGAEQNDFLAWVLNAEMAF